MANNEPLRGHLEPHPAQVEGRRHTRRALRLETTGATPGGSDTNVTVHNMSVAGLLIETQMPLELGDVLAVGLPDIGPVGAEIVWQSGRLYGCAFEQALGEAALAAAQLKGMPQIGGDASTLAESGPARSFATRDPLGVKLNRLRRERGLTLEQVATALGVSKPTVWAWEKGKARPLPDRFAAIARVLGVDQTALTESIGTANETAILDECRRRLAETYQVDTRNNHVFPVALGQIRHRTSKLTV